jgi:hypothetical protein
MRFPALLLLLLSLSACTPADGNGVNASTASTTETQIPTTEQSCSAAGGTWRRVCMMGTLACVIRLADAGKTCRGGNECLGRQCRYEGKQLPPGTKVTGKCMAQSDPCGCFTLVEDGKVQGGLCVD